MGAWESSISDLMRLALLGMIRGVWGLLIWTSGPPTPVDMDFDQRYTKTVLSNSIIKVARDSLKLRMSWTLIVVCALTPTSNLVQSRCMLAASSILSSSPFLSSPPHIKGYISRQ
jgi:hypothetical protein